MKIAIPNKGRLSEDIFDLLQRSGLRISKQDRKLTAKTEDNNYEINFVRTQDIPSFVSVGVADLGITGFDVLKESELQLEHIMDLNFGCCNMIVAVKEDSPYKTASDVPDGTKIATSFPNLTRRYFEERGKNVEIIEVSGATEIAPALGLADVIVDITSSGSTLKVNKLKIIGEILKSSAVIIGRPGIMDEEKAKIDSFCRAIKSAITAEEKKYLMANVPKSALPEIRKFLPGLASPTVISLLDNQEEVAIHVVVDKKRINESIDKLKSLGAGGILILTVDQMIP